MSLKTTIFALATASVRSGVAVFRISGPEAYSVITQLCRPTTMPLPRQACLRNLHHPDKAIFIDQVLVLSFAAPHSFTGENVVEIHSHGGRAVINAITECLASLPHFRLATPGEFTRRAFENDKMDLTEAEAIADLVNAETEAQRRQAARQFQGELGQLYMKWHQHLSHVLAYLEASIDFADEDIPQDLVQKQSSVISSVREEILKHLDDNHRGERLREGFSITIIGPPNAGKSSLLNILARREAAIVSSIAGTTRDIIEINLDLKGYPVVLADTAGLRESMDEIENEGIRRALKKAERADLKILVFDGKEWPNIDKTTLSLLDKNSILVVNKADLLKKRAVVNEIPMPFFISALTGEGIEALLEHIIHEMDIRFSDHGIPVLTQARHREALEECSAHLERALAAYELALKTEDLRLAMRALGRITGRVSVEDLLDIIFRDFCIGK